MPGAASATASTSSPSSHFDHECIPFKQLCGTGAEADHLRQGAAGPGDRICRRGRRHRAAAVAAAEAAAGAARMSTRVYERVDQPLVPVIGADGAARDQGRPRLSGAAVSASSPTRSRRSRSRSTRRRAGRSPSARRSSSARCCTSRLGLKGGRKGKSGAIFDRRQRARAARGRGRRVRDGWCSTGAS